ncbi:MAG: hypothetical protein ACM34H_01325 [Deltaproteobacteria bacterium]
MRRMSLLTMMVISCCFTAGAHGGGKSAALDRNTAQFANEVASKIVYRSDAEISVSARNCRLRIEFGTLEATFDLPLQGTTIAETASEDGIVLNNKQLTRTIKNKAPEAFENLILRFNKNDVKPMLKAFDRVITACNGKGSSMAAAR